MVNEKKINELEQKLAQLDKDYSDLGAYKEYGQVIKEVLGLLKESSSSEKESKLEKELNELKQRFDKTGFGQKFNANWLENYVNGVDKKVQDLSQKVNGYEDQIGRLKTELAKQKEDYSNKVKSMNNDIGELIGKVNFVNNDVRELSGKVKRLERNKEIGLTNLKEGDLTVNLGDGLFHGSSERIFDDQEVEIKGDTGSVYLQTNSDCFNSVCKRRLPGGNYQVTSTVCGEKKSQRITIDGDVNLYLKFSKK
jgi:predicted RNase H-like nuclease (RuvC/YqgF family)